MNRLLAAIVLAFVPCSAHAAGTWRDSFASEPVGSYIDSADAAVLVAGAGDSVNSDAVLAFIEGLRASGKVRLVMDGAALGSTVSASDAEIVKRASALPISVVAVVRVFRSGSERPPTCVVTLYSKSSGTVLAALSVARGTVLSPRVGVAALPSAAMESVSQVVHGSPAPVLTPKESFDAKAVWLSDGTVVDETTAGDSSATFVKGKGGLRLAGPELYNYIGQKGHAAEYRGRLVIKGALGLTGFTGILLPSPILIVAAALVPGPCVVRNSVTETCTAHDPNYSLIGAAVTVTALSVAAIVLAVVIDPEPVSRAELTKLVARFNAKVKKEADEVSLSETAVVPQFAWSLVPAIQSDGASLGLQLRF